MIIDSIENAERYTLLHPAFPKAFEFLKAAVSEGCENGRVEISGDEIYALINSGPGRKREESLLETHRRYIDIQFILEGEETFGWSPNGEPIASAVPYNEEKDIEFHHGEPRVWFSLTPMTFVIFHAGEAHLPGLSHGMVRKAVVKIKSN